MEDIKRRKGKMKGGDWRGDEPRETMDSGKQAEGFRGEGVWGDGLAR